MYFEVIANIDARVLPTEQAQAQRLREIAAYLTQEFSAHGKPRVVDIVDDATSFIHQYEFVDNEQIHWLNMSDEVYDWTSIRAASHPSSRAPRCYNAILAIYVQDEAENLPA